MLEKIEKYISEILSTQLSPNFSYHNLAHTKRVVEGVQFLTENSDIIAQEKENILVAAWFHDLGFIQKSEGHEQVSANMAKEFLEANEYPTQEIKNVEKLILATAKEIQPKSESEQIIKDADTSHLGSVDFREISEKLRQEENIVSGQSYSQLQWYHKNLEFLDEHQYYTFAAIKAWQEGKVKNMDQLKDHIDHLEGTFIDSAGDKEKTKRKYGRGVETMFRTTLKNHIQLSAIADSKANILLSVNSIIISIALSTLVPKLDNESNLFLVIPTLILVTFSVGSVIMSILSTQPNISSIAVTRDMIQNKQTNILFFGNFYKMNLEEFEWGINYLLENEDALYNSMTKDLFYLGRVLERKYRLLRITYTVFMIGIILSSLAFVLSYYFYIVKGG